MGIRIHKVIGYGLNDVKTEGKYNEILIDPRINPKGYFGDREEAEYEYTNDGFLEYAKELVAKGKEEDPLNDLGIMVHLLEKQKEEDSSKYGKHALYNRLIYDGEFGEPNVMVFQPPIFGYEWSRYDDMIDYYEEAHYSNSEDGGIINGYTMLDRSLYPYEGWCDHREMPPKLLTGEAWEWFRDSKNYAAQVYTDMALAELGFETVEEMYANVHPKIPKELVALLKYCKVFTKDEYIYQLRPMIYWYWG